MRGFSHRSQLVLFLAAVVLPGAALIVLSLRIAGQERELRAKRLADERRLVVERTCDALLALLAPIRAGETGEALQPGQTYRYPETALVAWSEDARLVLPWEPERDWAARHGRPQVLAPGRSRSRALLDAGASETDQDGVPLSLHAARALAGSGESDARIARSVESALDARPWLAPLPTFLATQTAERLARNARTPEQKRTAENLAQRAAAKVRLLQQGEALQNEFGRIRAVLASRPQPAWAPFGDELWLIGQRDTVVLAVRGDALFHRLAVPGAVRLADAREPAGEALGEALPGLKLVLAEHRAGRADPLPVLQRRLLYTALIAAIGATMFAAYLLWRDLRREMQASELRAQFVASVSHELKTPLTAIRMFAETLQLGRCPDEQTRAEYLGTIVSECERLSRLVDGVLMFSRSEQGRKVYRFRPVQPLEAAQAAVRALQCPLSQQGFHLRLQAAEDLPEIRADQDALEQAILNLLSNAIKFSGESRDIELDLAAGDGAVRIQVRDHGIGIAPQEQARIFDKFYRAPVRENQSVPGSGLGLALVRQIAQAHGGQVTVESAPGEGSTFTLTLPQEVGV